MQHNAEPEAVDLLMEVFLCLCLYITYALLPRVAPVSHLFELFQVEDLDLLVEHVDNTNYKRTCSYLTSSAKWVCSEHNLRSSFLSIWILRIFSWQIKVFWCLCSFDALCYSHHPHFCFDNCGVRSNLHAPRLILLALPNTSTSTCTW